MKLLFKILILVVTIIILLILIYVSLASDKSSTSGKAFITKTSDFPQDNYNNGKNTQDNNIEYKNNGNIHGIGELPNNNVATSVQPTKSFYRNEEFINNTPRNKKIYTSTLKALETPKVHKPSVKIKPVEKHEQINATSASANNSPIYKSDDNTLIDSNIDTKTINFCRKIDVITEKLLLSKSDNINSNNMKDLKAIFSKEPGNQDISIFSETLSDLNNVPFYEYIKNKSLKNFNQEFWVPFKSDNIEELRNKLYTVTSNEQIEKQDSVDPKLMYKLKKAEINSLSMDENTCYLITILYMIKANRNLLNFINTHCGDDKYRKTLIELIHKPENYLITQNEFNIITKTTPFQFTYGQQDDPMLFLLNILDSNCNISTLQFAYIGNLCITKTGDIYNDEPYGTEEHIAKFSPCPYGLTLPFIELFITDDNVLYNIQNILLGTNININAISGEKKYIMPIFTTAPPFLTIRILPGGYNNTDKEDFPFYNNRILTGKIRRLVYKLKNHGDLIFQDKIVLRSLFDKESKYQLTGFIVYKLYKVAEILSGHYIPYFKINDKWFCNYFEVRKEVTNKLKFPIRINNHERYMVTGLFYERTT